MRTVYAIDDDPDDLFLLGEALKELYQLSLFPDAEKALAQIKKAKPDIIILDVIMPQIDGPDLAMSLKSDPHTENVPIIFLTALATDYASNYHTYAKGGYEILAKPIDPVKLIQAIEKILAKSSPIH
jgi:CheY-like chemotaxis protein